MTVNNLKGYIPVKPHKKRTQKPYPSKSLVLLVELRGLEPLTS